MATRIVKVNGKRLEATQVQDAVYSQQEETCTQA